MHKINRIGTLAEKIVAIRITSDGSVTPLLRRRKAEGRMDDCCPPTLRRTSLFGPAEFVARVRCGDIGVAGIGIMRWPNGYYDSILPMGGVRMSKVAESHMGRASDETSQAERSSSYPEEIHFRFADGKLSWKSESVSGETVVNETYPEVEVSLRLPPGNDGEISFASPIFTTASGELAGVLKVA